MPQLNDIQLTSGTSLQDYISGCLAGLQLYTNNTDAIYSNLLVRSGYNGQKMQLQRALNEIFGQAANYITVVSNRIIGKPLYFYQPSESSPVYFSQPLENAPVFFFQSSESVTAVDFVVHVPAAIYTANLANQITAQVNLLKAVGPVFTVVSP